MEKFLFTYSTVAVVIVFICIVLLGVSSIYDFMSCNVRKGLYKGTAAICFSVCIWFIVASGMTYFY